MKRKRVLYRKHSQHDTMIIVLLSKLLRFYFRIIRLQNGKFMVEKGIFKKRYKILHTGVIGSPWFYDIQETNSKEFRGTLNKCKQELMHYFGEQLLEDISIKKLKS